MLRVHSQTKHRFPDSFSLFHTVFNCQKDVTVTLIQANHRFYLEIKDTGFRCTSFVLSLFHVTQGIQVVLTSLRRATFSLLACFCISRPLTIMLGASTDVRSNSYAKRRKDERKTIEDDRKGNRRVTLLTSITCQFTAVAP